MDKFQCPALPLTLFPRLFRVGVSFWRVLPLRLSLPWCGYLTESQLWSSSSLWRPCSAFHNYLLTPSLSLLPVAVFVLRYLRLGQHGLSIGGLLWVLSCFGSGSQFTWVNLVCLPSSYPHHPYGAVNGGGGGAAAAARA